MNKTVGFVVISFFCLNVFSSSPHHDGVSADQAIQWLKNGNVRYLKGNNRKDGKSQKERSKQFQGQKPHTIIVSCADSRVPPEIIFDQGLGEVFVVRVAGEALDTSVLASVEYAVEHLGAKHILVMGHTKCGAVKAAKDTKPGANAGSPSIDKMISDIQPRISGAENSEDLSKESFANADGVARDLAQRSEILKKLSEDKKIKINSALYNIKTGQVTWH